MCKFNKNIVCLQLNVFGVRIATQIEEIIFSNSIGGSTNQSTSMEFYFCPKFMHNIKCSLKTKFNLEHMATSRAQLARGIHVGRKSEQVARM